MAESAGGAIQSVQAPFVHACFLTWIEHRRTREIADRLGVPLVELTSKRKGLCRYAELVPRTIRYLFSARPRILLVQSPSMILSVLALLLRPLLGYRLILDAHNEAVRPYLHTSATVVAVTNWLLRRADRIIVTNPQLAATVEATGGTPIVLPDPIPSLRQPIERKALPGDFRIAVISTFAGDEPLEVVIDVAHAVGAQVQFFVTGNPAKLDVSLRSKIPTNMTLTGFLSEKDYWSLLASCEAVMDLTTMDDCLVCGAYEAIAVGRPLILSDNAASVETFDGFGVFTANTRDAVMAALTQLQAQYQELDRSLPEHRRAFEERWQQRLRALELYISS